MTNYLNLNGFISDNKVDIVVFDGDYFDSKLSLGDPASYYAVEFFNDVLKICREKHIAIRMVQGTRSHDLNQLQIFKYVEADTSIDFRIIETVQTEDFNGLKLLYLPEEYPQNCDEYYAEYKNEDARYNIIFGHGTWDFVAQQGLLEKGKNNDIHSAPVFIWKEWKHTIPDGFISFGHIHGRNVYGKKIFYSGSFSRWGFNELSARGFTYFEYDIENKTYKVDFIDNVEAPEYSTFAVKDLDTVLLESDVSVIQDVIEERLLKTDYLRVDLGGLSSEKIEILKKNYSKNPNVKIEVRTKTKSLLKESKEVVNFGKFHYITKRQLPLNLTIQKFCKEELSTELDISVIDTILS